MEKLIRLLRERIKRQEEALAQSREQLAEAERVAQAVGAKK